MRAVSKRRQKRDRNYPKARQAVHDRAGGMCEARSTIQCQAVGADAHHLAGRLGDDPHRLDNLLWVCDHCHRFIHSNPQLSYERGWMVRRNGPADRTLRGA